MNPHVTVTAGGKHLASPHWSILADGKLTRGQLSLKPCVCPRAGSQPRR